MTRGAAVSTSRRALAGASLALALGWAGAAVAQSGSGSPVVNCFDEARNIVTPMLSSQCEGRVVDDEEAKRIRDARLNRIRAGMAARQNTIFPGARLRSAGTGFFISADGALLTNHHVVDDCEKMTVESPDGGRARGRVVTMNKTIDLALVASEATPKEFARFSTADIVPGERADLFGYPTQGIAPEKPFYSDGAVAREQKRFRDPHRFLVETDVRSGNSGGPVLDQSGLVLGVVFAQINTVKVRKATGRDLPDTAVAIRNAAVREFLVPTGVKIEVANQAPALARDAVRKRARGFIARIACWQ